MNNLSNSNTRKMVIKCTKKNYLILFPWHQVANILSLRWNYVCAYKLWCDKSIANITCYIHHGKIYLYFQPERKKNCWILLFLAIYWCYKCLFSNSLAFIVIILSILFYLFNILSGFYTFHFLDFVGLSQATAFRSRLRNQGGCKQFWRCEKRVR